MAVDEVGGVIFSILQGNIVMGQIQTELGSRDIRIRQEVQLLRWT